MEPFRSGSGRFFFALWIVVLLGSAAAYAQGDKYPYRAAPRIMYVVGEQGWDGLSQVDGGKRVLRLYTDYETARQNASGGETVYSIYRHRLERTDDGKAFLEAVHDQFSMGKERAVLDMPLSSDESLRETVLKILKAPNDLGPVNPNWKTEGRYKTTKAMLGKYKPGNTDDDYGRGTYYFPNEGPPEAVNFISNYKVHFIEQPDGSVKMMHKHPDKDEYFPIETKYLTSDVAGACLFVMDAEGTLYAFATEWAPGLKGVGLDGLNHSSIPAGHPVAAAGQMVVHDGKLVTINPNSGHYQPTNFQLTQAIDALQLLHKVPKGTYDIDFRPPDEGGDHPGKEFVHLDPKHKEKFGDTPDDPDITKRPSGDGGGGRKPPYGDDSGLLEPNEQIPIPELETERVAREQPPATSTPEPPGPVEPPDKSVVEQIEKKIRDTDVKDMDVSFMKSLYALDARAAKVVAQYMATQGSGDKNIRMADLRKMLDLQVWKEILRRRGIQVEMTNQGKSNGIRSDLDYTLYFVADEAGVTVKELIDEHTKVWQELHKVTPDRFDIKVMNGDEFYPDWRNEAIDEAEHVSQVKEILGQLRQDPAKYSVPGANRQQVVNRAYLEGYTEVLRFDPLNDKPATTLDELRKQVVVDQGPARDVARRYQGVHPQYNRMELLGNVVQNTNEFLHHSENSADDAVKRAKYFNRVINEGLSKFGFYERDYARLDASDHPEKERLKLDYLRRALGVLKDDNGKPALSEADLAQFRKIVDLSMQIERDKTTGGSYSDAQRAFYFSDYRNEAERNLIKDLGGRQVSPEERLQLLLAEQEKLFSNDQKRVLAEAMLAGLRHSVARDLTPKGVLRNRVRFDPATQKFVINDAEAARKVGRERAIEVVLFFELVNSLDDGDPAQKTLKDELKRRALSTAPNREIAEFYRTLDDVTKAEVDRFVVGDADSKVQRSVDDLLRKQRLQTFELLIKRKQEAVARAKARGISVNVGISTAQVREHLVQARLAELNAHRRAQFRAAYTAAASRLQGDFREAFHEKATPLMMGSSAVNLIRAYQQGGADALPYAAFTELINYMPDYIEMPFTILDGLARVKQGDYTGAAWQVTEMAALMKYPALGNAMLVYNIVGGSFDIVRTHVVTEIDKDLTEQALRSRPRDANGGPLRDGVRARPNRFPDAQESVYNGSPPGFPLFYGRYRNQHAIAPAEVLDGEKYSDGRVTEDDLSDATLAHIASIEFAAQIHEQLTKEGLQPETDSWNSRAFELKLKYGFDIPFYRRVAKVYNEKYKYYMYIPLKDERGNPYYKASDDVLSDCRQDVYDWYVKQPEGYKLELAGDFTFLFGDQTSKMQEMVARQCASLMAAQHLAAEAQEKAKEQEKSLLALMEEGLKAEQELLAAKAGIKQKLPIEEEKAAAELDQQALALALQHQTLLHLSYPFTYATEELLPDLQIDVRSIPTNVKQPVDILLDEDMLGVREGAPSGWTAGASWADKFAPDAEGKIAYRTVTAEMKYTARLLDADKREVETASLTLPVVLYEPTFQGYVGVQVFGATAEGDSSIYYGALVTLGSETVKSSVYGSASFLVDKPGTYTIQVSPSPDDERHGPGSATLTVTDWISAPDLKGERSAGAKVLLPYIPPPKEPDIAENKDSNDDKGGETEGEGEGEGAGDGEAGGGKDECAGDKKGEDCKDEKKGEGPSIEEIIKQLAPLTSEAEQARDNAKAACEYGKAAAAQEQVLTAARDWVATTFPLGAPSELQSMIQHLEAELAGLRKAATAQEKAREHLREGLAAVQAKKAEPALAALEQAAQVPDVPECLHQQIMALYNEMKSDLEKRMELIDEAVNAANEECDYAKALAKGKEVEAMGPDLSWVKQELPLIESLEKRQRQARDLARQAEQKAQQAEQLALQGDKDAAAPIFDEAIALANQALQAAPECEKENLKAPLLAIANRKDAVKNPTIERSLVLLIDTSGSMADGGKMDGAKSAAISAVKALSPSTEVALITYDGDCDGGWRTNHGFSTDRAGVIQAIEALSPGGGTPMAPAIGFAHEYMKKSARSTAAQILLLSDGQNNCGSVTDAGSGIRKSNMSVRIDAVGFGLEQGSQAEKDLNDLVSAAGNGQTYSANTSGELISTFRRVFMADLVKPRDPQVDGQAGVRLAELFSAAVEYLKKNDLRGAVAQLEQAVTEYPKSAAAHFNASLGYEAGGQPLRALNHAKQYLALAPNAFDTDAVRERITELEAEQQKNPRAIYDPTECTGLYRWAQRESRQTGSDAGRKARVFNIMTTAQRGDCVSAEREYGQYASVYGSQR